jgi:hypothetical protein
MLRLVFMKFFLKIIIIFFCINVNTSTLAVEVIDKISNESKNIFKTLTRKSLKKEKLLEFILNNVIIIDDKRGDGVVTYYFEDSIYKRYKDLKIISQDVWKISSFGFLNILNGPKKHIWKVQIEKGNTINIKNKLNSVGTLHEFSYQDKTNYYIKVEEKKFNDNRQK